MNFIRFFIPQQGTQDRQRIAELRRSDLIHVSRFSLKYLMMPVFLGFILIDMAHGYRSLVFISARAGFLVLGCLTLYSYRFSFFQRRPFLPAFIPFLYATGFLFYVIATTGYESSTYYQGICQTFLGLLLFPFSKGQFLFVTLYLWGVYHFLTVVVSGHGVQTMSSPSGLAMNSYPILALCVFMVLDRTRVTLYEKTLQQVDELKNREEEIRDQAKALAETTVTLERERIRSAHLDSLNTLASQVSHDIQSPLAALEIVSSELTWASEDQKAIIQSATGRIKDIAHLLLSRNKDYFGYASSIGTSVLQSRETPTTVQPSTQFLPHLVESILAEKRAEYRKRIRLNLKVTISDYEVGLFAKVEGREFKRVLSNLINNAAESIEGAGEIGIEVGGKDQWVLISVTDTGKGIPPDIIPRLMEKGRTFGKPQGSGLGLFHAKETLTAIGGEISIQSTLGVGTSIRLSLPRGVAPSWFVPKLRLDPHTQVVIIDDDTSIHQLWKQRLSALNEPSLTLTHLSTPQELRDLCQGRRNQSSNPFLFLCDSEFSGSFSGSGDTGLDLILELEIVGQSILVTSRFEDGRILERCEKNGVRMLPKPMVGILPIDIDSESLER